MKSGYKVAIILFLAGPFIGLGMWWLSDASAKNKPDFVVGVSAVLWLASALACIYTSIEEA